MALDIKNGDFLVLIDTSKRYRIRGSGQWDGHRFGISRSFNSWAVTDCKTQRRPAAVGAKQAVPADNLKGLKCTPLDPVNKDTQLTLQSDTPIQLLATFISDGTDYVYFEVEKVFN